MAVCFLQGGVLGMVLDLSNSDKYYDPTEFTSNNIRYIKVCQRMAGCQGCHAVPLNLLR